MNKFNKICKHLIFIVSVLISALVLAQKEKVDWSGTHQYVKVDEQRIDKILQEMSLKRKVAQVIMPERRFITPKQFKKYQFGGMLNGGGSFPQNNKYAKVQDWIDELQAYHQASLQPLASGQLVPVLWGTDAVHGHNNVMGATLFPHNIALGSTNNPDLLQKIAKATAKETAATGIFWTFAPTLAVAQNMRWGRSYEGFGEDPKLVAKLGAVTVKGFQGQFEPMLSDQNVIATAKHFIGDGGTTDGVDQGDTAVSEQELRDIHAPGYYTSMLEGVQTVMATFNSWNGKKVHGDQYLLTEVLKNQMGFDGFVVGDWNGHGQVKGCTNDNCAQAFNAGIDMFMVPEDWKKLYNNLLAQVKDGTISEDRLNDAVRRILRVKMRVGLLDGASPVARAKANQGVVASDAHLQLAAEAAKQSAVLLKNNNRLLPLSGNKHYLVVGRHAKDVTTQMGGWSLTWQGTENKPSDFPNALSYYDAIAAQVKKLGGSVEFSKDGSFDKKPDVAIVLYGETPYAEMTGDRENLDLMTQQSGIVALRQLQGLGVKTVSILLSGRPLWVNPELNQSDAFIAAWWSGTRAGAIADLVFCQDLSSCDFSGSLSFAWPSTVDNESRSGNNALFQVGYGLSMTDKSNLKVLSEVVDNQSGLLLFRGRATDGFSSQMRSNSGVLYKLATKLTKSQDRSIQGRVIDLVLQEDGVSIAVNTKKGAQFIIASDKATDLTDYRKGYLEFSANFTKLSAKDKVNLSMVCQAADNCEYTIPIADVIVTKSLETYAISMQCIGDAIAIDNVVYPFILTASGKVKYQIGEVKLTFDTQARQIPCPN